MPKMNNHIHYICFYDIEDNWDEKRNFPLSAVPLIESQVRTLVSIGKFVDIVSMAQTMGKCNCPNKKLLLSQNVTLRLFSSIGRRNIVTRIVNYIWMRLQLLLYLLYNTNNDSTVIVYHSLSYMDIIKYTKILRKYKLILEVQEIYANVLITNLDRKRKIMNKELSLSKLADAYIFPTSLLNEFININNKPFVIVHGAYKVEPDRNDTFICDFTDNSRDCIGDKVIHCVYAGTLEPRKGAAAAVAAAEFLPRNYHIHILGFGSKYDIENIKETVNYISKQSESKVTYDGTLSGEDYIRFIQSCNIGLSTQKPESDFNTTSFPSKILSYLSNGLRVVSIRIRSVELSAVSDLIYYYDKQAPEEIAKAILSVDLQTPYESRKKISELAEQFEHDLSDILFSMK